MTARADSGAQRPDVLWFRVSGMWCTSCARAVEASLLRHPAVTEARVSATTGATRLTLNGSDFERELARRVERLGYRCDPWSDVDTRVETTNDRTLTIRFALALLLGMWTMLLQLLHYSGALGDDRKFILALAGMFATPVVWVAAAPFHRAAWRTLRAGVPGMDALVSVGSIVAWMVSVYALYADLPDTWFDTAALLVVFLLAARVIEAALRRRGFAAVQAVIRRAPAQALRLDDPTATQRSALETTTVETTDLVAGDVVVWGQGAALSVDGTVHSGEGWVDLSTLSGESEPQLRVPGDPVFAGCELASGDLTVKVERIVGRRQIDAIASGVRDGIDQRVEYQRVADHFAEKFVPFIVIAALLGGAVAWFSGQDAASSVLRAVSVLVVTCPCALSIAAPLALAFAVSRAAARGIVFREPDAIERACSVDTVVFDKTGTLTAGSDELEVIDGPEHTLALAAGAEWGVAHPVAAVIRAAAHRQGLEVAPQGERTVYPGQGVEWHSERGVVRVGSAKFTDDTGLENGQIAVVHNGTLVGRIAVRESLRPKSRALTTELRARGYTLHMWSGDSHRRVDRISQALEIPNARAEMGPVEKAAGVAKLELAGHRVAFVGDGINDAPALARAHLGIAVMGASDVALAAAPVLIRSGEMGRIADVLRIAGRTRRIVRQNLLWAVVYNTLAVPLAVAGFIAPVMAPLAMVLSSLSVSLNSLRAGSQPDGHRRDAVVRTARSG
ncbi:MAG: cation-translocating P-type ATPase [Myxococcota bacterium]